MSKDLTLCILVALFLSSCRKDNPVIGDQPIYPQIDAYPAWSPDGKSIIYNHGGVTKIHKDGSYESAPDSGGFWLVNPDGTNPHLVMKGSQENATWSSDGKWIAFELGAQIYKAPFNENGVDASELVQLTSAGRNFYPAWSPDGLWIAYDSDVNDPNGGNVIWVMKNDGTAARDISQHGTGEWRMPNWSPDSRRIAYQRYVGVGAPEIFTMDSAGKNDVQLTHDDKFDNYPKYSSDGLEIVFESNTNIWLMNTEGTNLKQLTTNGGVQPTWSPDGKKIAYISYDYTKYDPQNNGTVWIMNMDGSNKHQLTHGPAQN